MTPSQLIKVLEKHKTFLDTNGEKGKCLDLQAKDFKDLRLADLNLSKANLAGSKFTNVDMSFTDFTGANLSHCQFINCNLKNAYFPYAVLKYAHFHYCRLIDADFQEAVLHNAQFEHSLMVDSFFTEASCEDAVFDFCDLCGGDFTGAKLTATGFYNCQLKNVTLAKTFLWWSSHEILAEIIRKAAGDDLDKRQIAGLISISKDLCWDKLLKSKNPLKKWALETLAQYIVPFDTHPEILDKYK